LFWSCFSKEGDNRAAITFFAAASLFFCSSAEGYDNNVAITFCFGLATTNKAMIDLPSPCLLHETFFFFSCIVEGDGSNIAVMF